MAQAVKILLLCAKVKTEGNWGASPTVLKVGMSKWRITAPLNFVVVESAECESWIKFCFLKRLNQSWKRIHRFAKHKTCLLESMKVTRKCWTNLICQEVPKRRSLDGNLRFQYKPPLASIIFWIWGVLLWRFHYPTKFQSIRKSLRNLKQVCM